jgi:hypothetical protein
MILASAKTSKKQFYSTKQTGYSVAFRRHPRGVNIKRGPKVAKLLASLAAVNQTP